MRKGFTLVEMLVVIGIIAILIGVSMASFSKMSKSANKAKAQELVSNAMTALVALYDADGAWPKKIREQGKDGEMDADVALVLAKRNYLSLSTRTDDSGKKYLSGVDRLGVVTPWAAAAIKRAGATASLSTKVPSGKTVQEHLLHFAVDLDGDGITEASVGGQSVRIRATAAVWCCGPDGVEYSYSDGLKKGSVYSWSFGQTNDTN